MKKYKPNYMVTIMFQLCNMFIAMFPGIAIMWIILNPKDIKGVLYIFPTYLVIVLFFIISVSGIVYIIKVPANSKTTRVATIINNSSSMIYDSNGVNVTTLNLINNNSVEYSDLPDVFINALISAEDARFFEHSGVDFQRILSATINNVTTDQTQGASTLTQQLIKNTLLDSSKTLDRKINEIILSLHLENKLTKEQILEAYCNNIMFDGVTLGVNSASLKFFNKHISYVTLPEAALLAGIVNAPSYYNPIRNPDNAKKRMHTILNLMYRHGYISHDELNTALKVNIKDIVKESISKDKTYDYQAYLDIVYKQSFQLLLYHLSKNISTCISMGIIPGICLHCNFSKSAL